MRNFEAWFFTPSNSKYLRSFGLKVTLKIIKKFICSLFTSLYFYTVLLFLYNIQKYIDRSLTSLLKEFTSIQLVM